MTDLTWNRTHCCELITLQILTVPILLAITLTGGEGYCIWVRLFVCLFVRTKRECVLITFDPLEP